MPKHKNPLFRRWHALLLTAALLTQTGCPLDKSYNSLDYQTESGISTLKLNYGLFTVFYVTNRKHVANATLASGYYDGDRSETLAYGSCPVRVPRSHPLGGDATSIRIIGRTESFATTDVQIADPLSVTSDTAFYTNLNTAIVKSTRKDVLVLVHGYNNKFSDAIETAGSLGYDLGGQIVPIAFTWPSQGEPEYYTYDENDVDGAARQLAGFLNDLKTNLPTDTHIHLIAHSMGSRVCIQALRRLSTGDPPVTKPLLSNLIFAAADIDSAEFQQAFKTDGLQSMASHTTVYISDRDQVLRLSDQVHGPKLTRAGQAGANTIVIPGIDTIDASLVDTDILGHGYFGNCRSIIDDLFLLIMLGQDADHRNLYKVPANAANNSVPFWLVRP